MQVTKSNIVITDAFDLLAPLIQQLVEQLEISNLVVATDPNTLSECYPLIKKNFSDAHKAALICLPDGEQNKTLQQVTVLVDFLMQQGAGRATLLINLGGGMLCDLGGFAAAVYKRGIHCINIPTTLLAQVDAAVGGKTAVNYRDVKNLLGTFTLPAGVYINPLFTNTLPNEQWRSGLGELFKYGLIKAGIPLSNLLLAQKDDPALLLPLIQQAVTFKEEITALDPYDRGVRRILNFGHTVGHALEAAALSSKQKIYHGEAVAAGIVAETWLSEQKAGLDPEITQKVVAIYNMHFQKTKLPLHDIPALIAFMQQDKKNTNSGSISPVLLHRLASPCFDINVSPDEMEDALAFLKSVAF